MNITDKGNIYSTDLLFAFFIGTITLTLIIASFFNGINSTIENSKLFELKKNSFFITDSLVNNRNNSNALLGSTEYNLLKHRIEKNTIDLVLFQSINSDLNQINELKIKLIEIEFKNNEKKTIIEKEKKGNCIGTERFIIAENKKGKIKIVICSE
jgi:hypothetical protein